MIVHFYIRKKLDIIQFINKAKSLQKNRRHSPADEKGPHLDYIPIYTYTFIRAAM